PAVGHHAVKQAAHLLLAVRAFGLVNFRSLEEFSENSHDNPSLISQFYIDHFILSGQYMRYHTKRNRIAQLGNYQRTKKDRPSAVFFCVAQGAQIVHQKFHVQRRRLLQVRRKQKWHGFRRGVIDQEAGEHQVRQHLRGAVLLPDVQQRHQAQKEIPLPGPEILESLRRQAAVQIRLLPLGHHQDAVFPVAEDRPEKRLHVLLPGPLRPGQLLFQQPEQTAALLLHHLEGKILQRVKKRVEIGLGNPHRRGELRQ
ncbi:Inner membrane protein YjjP, partial [Dysosmobacter welbionis]